MARAALHVDPPLGDVAKGFRGASKATKKELGKLNKQYAEIPKDWAVQRANELGSGWVRLGRSLKTSATQAAVKVRSDARRYPDARGWEWGSLQYGQFGPWLGNGRNAGYVVAPMTRDTEFVRNFALMYQDAMTNFVNEHLAEYGLPAPPKLPKRKPPT